MNAFEHQKSIIDALVSRKRVQSRIAKSGAEWIDVARDVHWLDFVGREYRLAPPGSDAVYGVWDNEAGLYVNQIFHGPTAATQYAIDANAAAHGENRFVPVKLQRAPDGT